MLGQGSDGSTVLRTYYYWSWTDKAVVCKAKALEKGAKDSKENLKSQVSKLQALKSVELCGVIAPEIEFKSEKDIVRKLNSIQ